MIITPQILTIPPYLSTPWKEISFLYTIPEEDALEQFKLIVILTNQVRVVVPNLDRPAIEVILESHARFGQPASDNITQKSLDILAMQHNPDQTDAADLPKEMLEKITGIAKAAGMEDLSHLPKAEPHCNCPFCQISRMIHAEKKDDDEEIPDAELTFRTWDIKRSSEKLYLVTNPLDKNEYYSVYLGDPLGCTCGAKNCEHIRAVLNS